MSYQKLIAIGRLGKDPDFKTTESGISMCTFPLAVSEKYQKDGEWVEKTEWLKIVTFKVLADNCSKYLRKGSQAFIEGKMQTNKWQDKEGKACYSTQILANTVKFLDAKKDTKSQEVDIDSDDPEF